MIEAPTICPLFVVLRTTWAHFVQKVRTQQGCAKRDLVRKEGLQKLQEPIRIFFRHKMPALQRRTLYL